ncbi:unnamed protein product [Cylicocyclus nassatus]|uniref:7TM GPCR serpentine receptor class x (Srx) domain-containing protein n=1 Tax=Cylicocyclus nassatus TaxID=53992 RepID=A0AA36H398_CYLNA|nr:unnamed protein product [Cylicocyclus nassatus]
MDILIIIIAFKTNEIKRNYILHIILTAMLLDIAVYINVIFHDVPSFIPDRDVSTSVTIYLSVLALSLQYFAQLLFLPALSIIHYFAISRPAQFRGFSMREFTCVNVIVMLSALIIAAPLFTEYCGHIYLLDGHYWYFDFSKPYTYLYRYLNWTLQAICVIILVVADTLIIYKLFRLRTSRNNNRAFASTSNKSGARKKEHLGGSSDEVCATS